MFRIDIHIYRLSLPIPTAAAEAAAAVQPRVRVEHILTWNYQLNCQTGVDNVVGHNSARLEQLSRTAWNRDGEEISNYP